MSPVIPRAPDRVAFSSATLRLRGPRAEGAKILKARKHLATIYQGSLATVSTNLTTFVNGAWASGSCGVAAGSTHT